MKTLRTLIELSTYVPNRGPKKQLYDLALTHSGNRAELAEHFVSRAYFRVVYKNLKDALLDGILRPKWQLSEALSLEFKIRERYLESLILIRSGKSKVGMIIAEETLALALKYEFVDIALPLCKALETLYSTVDVSTKKKYKYSRLSKQLLEAYI